MKGNVIMKVPTIEQAESFLLEAGKLNPGPWIEHSLYAGKAAQLIAREDKDLDENIALVRTGKGYFLPGGGIEGNETHAECLKRECTEEIGYNIKLGEYIGKASNYTLSFKTNEYLRVVGDFYRAQLLEANYLKVEEDHELVWLPPEEAIDKMYVEFQAWAIKRL